MDSGTAKARISPQQNEQALDQIRAHQLAHFLHELRNRLVALRGYANLAVVSHPGKRKQPVPETLKNLVEHTNQLIALTIRFEQCQSSELTLEPVDVAQLARKAVERCRTRALRRAVALDERIISRPVLTFGDRRRIQALLVKVLSRSIHAAEAGGRVDFRIASEGEEMSIQVSNGRTSKRVLGRLSADNANSSEPADHVGAGLIRNVAQLLGGTVSVAENSGEWRSTTVTLPVIQITEYASREQL
jgi:two-component system, sensor histidine kinase